MRHLYRYDIPLVILLFLLSLPAEYFEIFSLLEDQTLSFRHALRSTLADRDTMRFSYDRLSLVTVDDAFFDQYGKYPLKRSDLAEIIRNIHQLGAKVICVDFLLHLPDAYGDDLDLAMALNESRAVMASQVLFDGRGRFTEIKYPHPVFRSAATSGYVNLVSPSSARTYLSRLHINPKIIDKPDGWPISVQLLSQYTDTAPRLDNGRLILGDRVYPLDSFNDIYIDFSAIPEGYTFLHEAAGITAAAFLDISGLPAHRLRELKGWVNEKIVIIGDTSAASNDWFDTPVGMVYGAEIIADTVNTLLKHAPLRPLPFWAETILSFLFLSTVFLTTSLIRRPIPHFLAGFLLLAGFIGCCTAAYIYAGLAASMTYTLIVCTAGYVILSLSSRFRERKISTAQRMASEKAKRDLEIAEAASRARSAFFASMSHELRTPLNSIIGFAEIIADRNRLDSEHREYVGLISKSGKHLLTLINQVMDMAKAEAGKMMLDESGFDLYELLEDVKEMFHPELRQKGLTLTVDHGAGVPRHIIGDFMKLKQILINLAANAVKFTDQGGVTFTVENSDDTTADSPCHTNKHRLRFKVADTGTGIAPDEQAHLFDAFTQTESGRRSGKGTGLGLAVSQKFVQLMGGDLTVSSERGKGSVFTFDICIRTAETKGEEKGEEIESGRGEPENASMIPENRLAPEDIAALPAAIQKKLLNAANMLDLFEAETLVEEIREDHPRTAEAVQELLRRFDFDALQELLGNTPENHARPNRPH